MGDKEHTNQPSQPNQKSDEHPIAPLNGRIDESFYVSNAIPMPESLPGQQGGNKDGK